MFERLMKERRTPSQPFLFFGEFPLHSGSNLEENMPMESTLEQRVMDLEKRVAELTAKVTGSGSVRKDWRKTVGMLPDDEISREADRLGREWREEQRRP
jgi:hypothetical protein